MENTADFIVLRKLELFKALSDPDIKKLLEVAFVKDYMTGAVLFNEGMDGDVMYVIIEGEVDLFRKNENKENILLAKLGRGDFFGEMSMIENEKRSASAKISVNAKLLVITRRTFDKMLEVEPQISSKILVILLKTLSRRLRLASKKQ